MITSLRQTFSALITFLTPNRYFSWQTVLYMSLFSWFMSLLSRLLGASPFTVALIATLGWIFLALGIGWAIEDQQIKPFGLSIAPWVSGAILCVFMFGSWGGRWLQPALTFWPLMSFLVVAVPNLVSWELKPKVPVPAMRQKLILLFFLSLLFSSWFQFYFRIQTWLQAYPSLVADKVEDSNFVYRIPGQAVPLSAGVTHLTQAETWIKAQVNDKPWSGVERWLLNLKGQQQSLQQQIQATQSSSPEDELWELRLQTVSNGPGYNLKLQAVWKGPAANSRGYYLEKVCEVMPSAQAPSASYRPTQPDADSADRATGTQWARVTCGLETPRLPGQP